MTDTPKPRSNAISPVVFMGPGEPSTTNKGDIAMTTLCKEGDRIELIYMGDDPRPIPVGTKGTITRVHDCKFNGTVQIGVSWDNGRTLSLIHPTDRFQVIERAASPAQAPV